MTDIQWHLQGLVNGGGKASAEREPISEAPSVVQGQKVYFQLLDIQ